MSSPDAIVRCTNCNFEQRWEHKPIILCYLLDDDRNVESHRVQAWCSSCEKMTSAEHLPSIEELAEEVRKHAHEPGVLSTLLAALTWRAARRRAPRCLSCGSSAVQPIEWRPIDAPKDPEFDCPVSVAAGFRHTCSGLLLRRYDRSMYTEWATTRILLSTEGDVLAEEDVDDEIT